MNLNIFSLTLLYILYHRFRASNSETITYISTERPAISWYDTKYFKYVNISSRRISRQDPKHYVNLFVELLTTWDNQIAVDFYFYQFLTNRYRRSFVEMHYRFCDLLEKDVYFGSAVKRASGNKSCPFPPDKYNLSNMYIPLVPKGFPFLKGRIQCNISHVHGGVTNLIVSGGIDMEVKTGKIITNSKKGLSD